MNTEREKIDDYQGYELGPIRPPSEANSLLLRITRNCPWNRCKFCGLYRGKKFSIRPIAHILKDIDKIRTFVSQIQDLLQQPAASYQQLSALQVGQSFGDRQAFHAALDWLRGGMTSVFLQDANTLVVKPDDLVRILEYLRKMFPQIERITCYARSHSVARIRDADLSQLAQAGLNRIHIGLESGADEVLGFINKGVDKQTHILAGQKVMRAGIELSEYFMPGLGGKQWTMANALETADALNRINPDFIRIRTLAIPQAVDLYQNIQAGSFTPLGDIEKAEELLMFLDNLQGITSTVKSDHILNLFQEVEGRLPEDKEMMSAPIRSFLSMNPELQLLYLVGRRCGIFARLSDIDDFELYGRAEQALVAHQVSWENVDDWTAKMMQRFI